MATFFIENNFFQATSDPSTPVISDPIYEARAIFSISASNQLQGTIWVVKNGQILANSLGTASYVIYDKDGVDVGISESGIVADANGQYIISPINASAIQDLTHYVVKITVSAESQNRINYVGITLGE